MSFAKQRLEVHPACEEVKGVLNGNLKVVLFPRAETWIHSAWRRLWRHTLDSSQWNHYYTRLHRFRHCNYHFEGQSPPGRQYTICHEMGVLSIHCIANQYAFSAPSNNLSPSSACWYAGTYDTYIWTNRCIHGHFWSAVLVSQTVHPSLAPVNSLMKLSSGDQTQLVAIRENLISDVSIPGVNFQLDWRCDVNTTPE